MTFSPDSGREGQDAAHPGDDPAPERPPTPSRFTAGERAVFFAIVVVQIAIVVALVIALGSGLAQLV